MEKTERKVILIGIDGLLPGLVKKFRSLTPNTDRLIREGVFSEALACMPTDTPTNWTTIATGADTKTHGVRGFPKRPDGKISSYFDSCRCKAEFLWEALEREDKQAILLNYPTAWPVRTKNSTIVGGDGVFSPNWRIGDLVYYSTQAKDTVSSQELLFDVRRNDLPIDLRKAEDWSSLPKSELPPLEAKILSLEKKNASWSERGYVSDETGFTSVSGHYFLLVTGSSENGYDTVTITSSKDATKALCKLQVGDWSDWIFQDFTIDGCTIRGSFKFKLIELSPDAKNLRLYRTMVSTTEGWTKPESLAKELIENVGPYHEGWENSPMEMAEELGIETLVEHAQMQADWIANTACYLASRQDWHLLMAQVHIQDSYNHRFMHLLEPLCKGYSEDREEDTWKLFTELYKITDNMIGKILKDCADENTTVIVLSDHGCVPVHTRVCVQGILVKAGLLEVCYDSKTDNASIDYAASKLEPMNAEKIRDDTISVLTSIRDQRTGVCPIALAMHKNDVPILGPGVPQAGEFPFFLKAGYKAYPLPKKREAVERMLESENFFVPYGYGEHHGLPTIRFKDFSNTATFIISGAGIVEGKELSQPIALKDVTPTIAHLLGIAPPRNSEGRVVRAVLK